MNPIPHPPRFCQPLHTHWPLPQALAGALMQVLLRNPLADPYILGISGGAAVAALGANTLGAATFWVDASAFAGALAAMLVVFGLAHGEQDAAQMGQQGQVVIVVWIGHVFTCVGF